MMIVWNGQITLIRQKGNMPTPSNFCYPLLGFFYSSRDDSIHSWKHFSTHYIAHFIASKNLLMTLSEVGLISVNGFEWSWIEFSYKWKILLMALVLFPTSFADLQYVVVLKLLNLCLVCSYSKFMHQSFISFGSTLI